MPGKASLRERTFQASGILETWTGTRTNSFFCSALSVVSEHEPRARYFSGHEHGFLNFACQIQAISLKCLKFYSRGNYGLGWGPSLITSTSDEHVFYPSHEHGSSPVHGVSFQH